MARPDDLHLPLVHYVPTVVEGRRDSLRFAFSPESIPVGIRGVDPALIEERLLPDAGLPDDAVLAHAGKLWIPIEYAPTGRGPRQASLAEAVAVLSGDVSPANLALSPLRPVVPPDLLAPGGRGDRPLHPRLSGRALLSLRDVARRRADAWAADDLVHDGNRILRALPIPCLGHEASGVGCRTDVTTDGWRPLFSPYRARIAADTFEGPSAEGYRHGIGRLAERWSPSLTGVADDESDVRHFVREGAYALMRAMARVEDRHSAFDRARARIVDIAARASIDAMQDALPQAVDTLRELSASLEYWVANGRRMTERHALAAVSCQRVFSYARTVAIGAYGNGQRHPEDAQALEMLAP